MARDKLSDWFGEDECEKQGLKTFKKMINLYKCDNCGKVFVDENYNLAAAAFTTLNCKKCGSYHTYPIFHGWPKKFYEGLWKERDEKEKHQSL